MADAVAPATKHDNPALTITADASLDGFDHERAIETSIVTAIELANTTRIVRSFLRRTALDHGSVSPRAERVGDPCRPLTAGSSFIGETLLHTTRSVHSGVASAAKMGATMSNKTPEEEKIVREEEEREKEKQRAEEAEERRLE
ncbi:hypothetical protein E6C70_02085 [Glaciibacter flavus]|uniref:Uncharacterized protein n=1 Tax=Orlajensenia flava TaxID=2565934 RepID=A0A4S4FYT2_9MICO|nr:hypothetical protein [Glaciibacter flavus]THG34896.1 hypothetical protein E6C70_02085 [Glaciibacter flavus]